MAYDEEEEPVLLERSARATRGKRMTKLLDEEIDQDEAFWNQDALKEEEVDDNYEEEAEVADEFDSDFNEDEPDPDEEPENEDIERLPLKKRLIFPGKLATKKKSKKKVLSKLEKVPKKEKSSEKPTDSEEHQDGAPDELEVERTVRKSTRTSVIVRQAERDAIRAALQATMKPIKRKKEGEDKRMTQEEMLLEAAETEVINQRNLERVLAREEEVKKKAVVHKEVYDGPLIRFTSKDGKSLLEFMNGPSFKSEISSTPVPYPQRSFCVITGLPAKYRDPKTGLPYATKEAFKTIRERFIQQECERKTQIKMNMGELFDSLSGEGFMHKRRRSEPGTKKFLDLRLGARFRSIPALNMIEEE